MCTAVSLRTESHYFGRNLDLDRDYGEEIAVMPRRYPVAFGNGVTLSGHFAVIGMAKVVETDGEKNGGYPLFFDAVNEQGLAVAGLNFPHNAYYVPRENAPGDRYAVASFELIPWLLCRCGSVSEARELLEDTVITDESFGKGLSPTPLHWMISDGKEDAVIECTEKGMRVTDNPVGVLTNNPPFEYQCAELKKYSHLTAEFRDSGEELTGKHGERYFTHTLGAGGGGLPGDSSSRSRFVRAVFNLKSSASEGGETDSVGQLFHILSSVEVVKGSCKTETGREHFTRYSSCMSAENGRYYYTTYGNRGISCVDMHRCRLDGDVPYRFKLLKEGQIYRQN